MDEAKASARRLRVLVVDDDAASLKLTSLLVEQLGHGSATATNGREAVDLALRDKPDVVLMDIDMPRMDGFEAARRIWERAPEAQPPHIVAVTVSSFEGDMQTRAVAAGMGGYIRKPFDEERLSAVFAALYPPGESLGHGRDRLRALFADDTEAARQIADILRRAREQILPDLEHAARDGDLPSVAEVAHHLKGQVKHVGAEKLWAACAAVEAAARNGAPLQRVDQLVERVSEEWSTLEPLFGATAAERHLRSGA